MSTNQWHRRLEFPSGETIVMHNPKVNPLPLINPLLIGLATFAVVSLNRCLPVLCWQVIVQFQPSSIPDEWGTTPDGQTRPRVVKRGIDDDLDEVTDGRFCRRSCVAFQRLFANVCVVENFFRHRTSSPS